MAPILRLYSGYVRNFEQANKTLAQCRENAAFVELLTECEANAKGLQLESYLIMPVQRLPRYQMLLNGLLKYTDEQHVDYADLCSAQQSIINICTEINTQKVLDENQKTLRNLVEEVRACSGRDSVAPDVCCVGGRAAGRAGQHGLVCAPRPPALHQGHCHRLVPLPAV